MDNLAYLNQISQSNRPTKRHDRGKGANSLIIKLIIGGLVLFFLLMAIGALLGNLGSRSRNLAEQIYTRSANLNSTLQTYTPNLKSSRLRAIGSSLSSILINGTNQLSAYLIGDDEDKDAPVSDQKIIDEELALQQELNLSLNNAKLNGILDRVYETQITLQVSLLVSLTSQLLERSSNDPELTKIIEPLHNSLLAIQGNLESYNNPSS